MLNRIASIVVAVIGIMAALLIGLWTLIVLGIAGLAVGCIRFFRRSGKARTVRPGRVVEGEFEVVEENTEARKHES